LKIMTTFEEPNLGQDQTQGTSFNQDEGLFLPIGNSPGTDIRNETRGNYYQLFGNDSNSSYEYSPNFRRRNNLSPRNESFGSNDSFNSFQSNFEDGINLSPYHPLPLSDSYFEKDWQYDHGVSRSSDDNNNSEEEDRDCHEEWLSGLGGLELDNEMNQEEKTRSRLTKIQRPRSNSSLLPQLGNEFGNEFGNEYGNDFDYQNTSDVYNMTSNNYNTSDTYNIEKKMFHFEINDETEYYSSDGYEYSGNTFYNMGNNMEYSYDPNMDKRVGSPILRSSYFTGGDENPYQSFEFSNDNMNPQNQYTTGSPPLQRPKKNKSKKRNKKKPGNYRSLTPGPQSKNYHNRKRPQRKRGGSLLQDDPNVFELKLDDIENGIEKRTTLMIQNIPNKYDQDLLLETVNKVFIGTYDFFYLPMDFKNKCNVGYAFVNFLDPKTVINFYNVFNDKMWPKFNSIKVCKLTYARLQGKKHLIEHFKNSSLMKESPKYRPLLFHSTGTNMGQPEPFPIGNPRPKKNGRYHKEKKKF